MSIPMTYPFLPTYFEAIKESIPRPDPTSNTISPGYIFANL